MTFILAEGTFDGSIPSLFPMLPSCITWHLFLCTVFWVGCLGPFFFQESKWMHLSITISPLTQKPWTSCCYGCRGAWNSVKKTDKSTTSLKCYQTSTVDETHKTLKLTARFTKPPHSHHSPPKSLGWSSGAYTPKIEKPPSSNQQMCELVEKNSLLQLGMVQLIPPGKWRNPYFFMDIYIYI